MNMDILSLVEKSVRVIPLDKKEWEARAGITSANHYNAASTTAAAAANEDDEEAKDSSSIAADSSNNPLVFPTTSHLRKACLATSTSPSSLSLSNHSNQSSGIPLPPSRSSSSPNTPRNRKTANRKTLIAACERWIMQNYSKGQKGKACPVPCVKILSTSRVKEDGTGGYDNYYNHKSTNPQALLDAYVRSERASDPSIRDRTKKPAGQLSCALLKERDLSRSLLLRCNNTLLDGEIFSSNPNASNNNDSATVSSSAPDSSPSRTAILRCAASLYYRIWYFRTIRKKDLRRAYGFALASSVSGTGSRARVTLRVNFLLLEKPSDTSGLSSPSIGGRYPLYVYKRRYDLPKEPAEPTSSTSLLSTTSTILNELAEFLYHQTESLPCPYKDTAPLIGVKCAPGGMLLPDEPFLENGSVAGSIRSSSSSQVGAIPMHLDGCRIIPTITGSLVIFCVDTSALNDILARSGPAVDEKDDVEGLRELFRSFSKLAKDSSSENSMWYAKYKAPSSGFIWDNSRAAINGPRSRLQTKRKIKQIPCVKRWAFLHPIDSWVGSFRSITITRSAGIDFSRAFDQYEISWASFQKEFLGLATSTLELQNEFGSLVHGDIHEGNVLYYPPFHNESESSDINNGDADSNAESDTLFPAGQRLVLIDWDEARRPKPFRRSANSVEERMRYPDNLVDFPKQYTEQQLMHLFKNLCEQYYPSQTEKVISGESADDPIWEWMRAILVPPSPPSSRATTTTPMHASSFAKFLYKKAVEERFKAMLRGLTGDSWWTMNWGETGLDDGSYHVPNPKKNLREKVGSFRFSNMSTRW